MKKILLSVAVACAGFSLSSNAQLAMQDFESVTVPALPAGWVNSSGAGAPGWQTGTSAGSTWGASTLAYNMPAHTKFIYIDDAAGSTGTNRLDTLKSPVFTMPTGTHIYLNFDYFFYKAVQTSTGKAELCFIMGSNDGGATWMTIDSVAGSAWNGGGNWSTAHKNLSSSPLSGSNCRIAFAYTDGTGDILGIGVDNIELVQLTNPRGAVTALGYDNINNLISIDGTTMSFIFENRGVPVTSFDAYYRLNSGAIVSQTFTPTTALAPYSQTIYTFTTPVTGMVSGSNTLRVSIPTVNTTANTEPTDSFRTSTFTKASASVQRKGLIEEFSSSTCAPCKSFNQNYDPLCTTLGANTATSNFNIIKYQMNWPTPGTDSSYNADGNTRKTYYNVGGIPDHYVNGRNSTVSWTNPFTATNTADFTAEAASSYALKSYFDMTGSYSVDTIKKKLYINLSVTPRFTKTGSYHVYIAVMDKHYQNTKNTTGQLDYYHVMRKMLPNGSGRAVTSWTDGTAVSYVDTGIAYTAGNWAAGSNYYPAQNSNTFWSNPLGGELVAFIEEDGPKSVMQSLLIIPTQKAVSVTTLSKVNDITVFPNPTSSDATVSFSLGEAGKVHIKILDVAGREVADVVNKEMNTGVQNVNISTAGLAAGEYLIMIETAGGANLGRLTVTK
ncbi:MAG: hypothetical protein K0Q79_193 [Flavipsychrobacter sp.]|jgi:hypothetical protein|nr:hypothetical protein [Flavipsychrobacter sp.]